MWPLNLEFPSLYIKPLKDYLLAFLFLFVLLTRLYFCGIDWLVTMTIFVLQHPRCIYEGQRPASEVPKNRPPLFFKIGSFTETWGFPVGKPHLQHIPVGIGYQAQFFRLVWHTLYPPSFGAITTSSKADFKGIP